MALARANIRWTDPQGPVATTRVPLPARRRKPLYDAAWDFPPGTPGASGVQPPPTFLTRLRQIDPKATVTFQPVTKRWVIWRMGRRGHWVCVCPVQNPNTGEPWPLDNRILGIMYASNPATYGGAKAMWLQVRNEMLRREEAQKEETLEVLKEVKKATDRHTAIRVGYGRSPGDKFSNQVSDGPTNKVPDFTL